jgi:hypothetical protein
LTIVSAAVCVPVRNEQEALPLLLRALAGLDLPAVDLAVFFFLDSCTDASRRVLESHAADLPFRMAIAEGAPSADANAGRARRSAMTLGLAHARSRPNGLLLSTDADSQPRPDWICAARRGLETADIVAGRLLRTAGERDPSQGRVEHYLDRLHAPRRTIDPVPWDSPAGSHCSGGANLGFRLAAYEALGGFKPLSCGEDAVLLDDASRAGLRVRREPGMVVETSSRRDGRVPGGLAATLREIDGNGAPTLAHPHAAVWQYRTQAEARGVFDSLSDARAAARSGELVGLSADHVIGVARDCPNAEAFAMRVVPSAPFPVRTVTLDEAEQALAVLELEHCKQAA